MAGYFGKREEDGKNHLWEVFQTNRLSLGDAGSDLEINNIPSSCLMDLPHRQTYRVEAKLYKEHTFGLNLEEENSDGDVKPHLVALDKSGGRQLFAVNGQYRGVISHMIQATWDSALSQLNLRYDSDEWYEGIKVIMIGQLDYDNIFYFDRMMQLNNITQTFGHRTD